MTRPIADVASSLEIPSELLIPYGHDKAKIHSDLLAGPRLRAGKPRLVLVSAMTPTPAGEGKTTTTIGLGQAFTRLGESVCVALREPSLGPCMGIKGGGTGGGRSCLVPSDDINLHFTGDFHAVTSAHNLLAAMLDNHLYFGNKLGIDPRRILWKRVLDMNDRALRRTIIGLGGHRQGVPRETGFDITPASEVMAMLCLAEGADDLRERIHRTLVALTYDGEPVTAERLGAAGAMLALLRDAIHPNLVQTVEGTPAVVHGGPFANIAHGCNSVMATRTAMHVADWTITEAGFGFDLGAEKFFDIKCVSAGLDTAAVVLVATIRALKMHGGVPLKSLDTSDPGAVERGLPNLAKHIENIGHFRERPVVALNHRDGDTEAEIDVVRRFCTELGVPFAVSRHFAEGGAGAEELARLVIEQGTAHNEPFAPLYDWKDPVEDKIRAVARTMYGADDIVLTKNARRELKRVRDLGYEHLPICIAKTQKSLSDDTRRLGRPSGFDVTVAGFEINAGAGFLVVLTGDILRMPGLPRVPQAEAIDLSEGNIRGLR